jgi:hypothetical protein
LEEPTAAILKKAQDVTQNLLHFFQTTHSRAMAQAVSRRPLTAEARVRSRGLSMWDLWWKKWHWDRFFFQYFGFPLSISFHHCSIKMKSRKNLIIFLTGLHNKPQGCGASVASAAGPFSKKNSFYRTLSFTGLFSA